MGIPQRHRDLKQLIVQAMKAHLTILIGPSGISIRAQNAFAIFVALVIVLTLF